MSNPVIHFEFLAENPEKLAKFYRGLFGWKIEKVEEPILEDPMEYWSVETVPVDENMQPTEPGINGGIVKKMAPEQKSLNYVSVESIDESTKKIQELGGKILLPKQKLEGVGDLAVAEDPEGNIFGLWTMEEKD